jgi:phosphoglycerate kinase
MVRADYNVPIDPDGEVRVTSRVDATLATLEALRAAGARIVLVSHLGRPNGTRDPKLSLAPVARLLSDRLKCRVPLIEDTPGSPRPLEELVGAMAPRAVLMLENVRFHPGETRNDPELGRELGRLVDGFVSEAFGVAHRAHASNVGAARWVRDRGGPAVAGFLMARELHFLRETLRSPERPFVVVMGGAKISGKLELIRSVLDRVDRLLVGGAVANTFLKALGLETGDSLVEDDLVPMAADLLEVAGDKLLLPVDCVAADEIEEGAQPLVVDRSDIANTHRVGDLGPRSRAMFARELAGAATILWNGPVGVFELSPFREGTLFIGRALAEAADRGAVVVLGGGDSAAAANAAGVLDRMTHVSTGGGASLDLLAGNELPGVSVLETVDA